MLLVIAVFSFPVGSIPSYYREVFDIVAPPGGNKVTRSLWIRVFSTSHVSEKTLEEVRNKINKEFVNKWLP